MYFFAIIVRVLCGLNIDYQHALLIERALETDQSPILSVYELLLFQSIKCNCRPSYDNNK